MNSKPRQEEGLLDFITNIIIRPPRELYTIDRLGLKDIAVKSNLQALKNIQGLQKPQQNSKYTSTNDTCEFIEVHRKEVTIVSNNNLIQISVYQPKFSKQAQNSKQIHFNNQIFSTSLVSTVSNKEVKNQSKELQNQLKAKSYNRCVVFLHANSGSRLQCLDYIKYVLQYQSLCVSFDYSGGGLSEGSFTSMGVKQSADLSNVIQQINKTYKIQKFSLWGRSMGAVTGLYYLLQQCQTNLNSKNIQIQSCILDSPFSNLEKLVLQIASNKTGLPQFIFNPLVSTIQERIKAKIGVNIFQKLNLVKKLQNLSLQQKKQIQKVRLLFLASRQDRLIKNTHSQFLYKELCNQKSNQDKNIIQLDSIKIQKQFKMLYEWRKSLKMNGDFLQIQGDHNKPRSNQVKEKCSLFLHFQNKNNHLQQAPKQNASQSSFKNTGTLIKQKLSFAKKSNQTLKLLNSTQRLQEKAQNQVIQVQRNIKNTVHHLHSAQKQKQEQQVFINLSYFRNSNIKNRQSLSKNKINNFKKTKTSQQPTPQRQSVQCKKLEQQTQIAQKRQTDEHRKGLNIVSKQINKSLNSNKQISITLKQDIVTPLVFKSPQKTGQHKKILSSHATCVSPCAVNNQGPQFFNKKDYNDISGNDQNNTISKLVFKQKKVSLGNQKRSSGINSINTSRKISQQFRQGLLSQRNMVNKLSNKNQQPYQQSNTMKQSSEQYSSFLKRRNEFNDIKASIHIKKSEQATDIKMNHNKNLASMTEDSFSHYKNNGNINNVNNLSQDNGNNYKNIDRNIKYHENVSKSSIRQMKTSNLSSISQNSQSSLPYAHSQHNYQHQINNNYLLNYQTRNQQQHQHQQQKQSYNLNSPVSYNLNSPVSYNLNSPVSYSVHPNYEKYPTKPQTPETRTYYPNNEVHYPYNVNVNNKDKLKPMSQSTTLIYQATQFRFNDNTNMDQSKMQFNKMHQTVNYNQSQQLTRNVVSQKYPTRAEIQQKERKARDRHTVNQNAALMKQSDNNISYNNVQDEQRYTLKIKSMRGSQQINGCRFSESQGLNIKSDEINYQRANFYKQDNSRNNAKLPQQTVQNKQVLHYKTKITSLL